VVQGSCHRAQWQQPWCSGYRCVAATMRCSSSSCGVQQLWCSSAISFHVK